MKKTVLALLVAGVAGAAHAGGHWYAGVGLGQSRADNMGDPEVLSRLFGWSVDNTSTSWKVFAGYNMGKSFAVEGGYADFGKFKTAGDLTSSSETKGLFVDAVAKWTATPSFGLFGKAGIAYTDTDLSVNFDGDPVVRDDKGRLTPKLGLGMTYSLSKNMAVRAEYERYFGVGGSFADVNGFPVRYKPGLDVWTLGLQVGF